MEKEDIPNKIEVSEEEVIKILKERGIHDVAAMMLLDRWTAQEEKKISERPKNERKPTDSINLDRRRGQLYAAAGFTYGAIISLKQAAFQAKSIEDMQLWNEIYDEIWDEVRKFESVADNENRTQLYKQIVDEANRTGEY